MARRLSVYERSSSPPAFRLTERDISVLSLIHELGFTTSTQVHRALFGGRPGTKTSAEERLKYLFQHGYLERLAKPPRGIGQPKAVYHLSRKGRDLLAEHRGIPKRELTFETWDRNKSPLLLDHTLAITDLRINLLLGCQLAGHRLVSWISERALRTQSMRDVVEDPLGGGKIPIVPDGWGQIELSSGRKFSFFVELDRATEDRKQFQRKIRGYLAYWETGAYIRRYQSKCMTVLTVVDCLQGAKRVNQLKSWVEAQSHLARLDTFEELFWFSDLTKVTPQRIVTEPVWQIAGKSGAFQLVQ